MWVGLMPRLWVAAPGQELTARMAQPMVGLGWSESFAGGGLEGRFNQDRSFDWLCKVWLLLI